VRQPVIQLLHTTSQESASAHARAQRSAKATSTPTRPTRESNRRTGTQ